MREGETAFPCDSSAFRRTVGASMREDGISDSQLGESIARATRNYSSISARERAQHEARLWRYESAEARLRRVWRETRTRRFQGKSRDAILDSEPR